VSTQPRQKMLGFEEAQELILDRTPAGTETLEIPITQACGHILAEAVRSPIDMPAFDRAAMDGFAFTHGEHADGATLEVVATVAAGTVPQVTLETGQCVEIMTGAPVPAPADTVIPVEETSPLEPRARGAARKGPRRVRFHTVPPRGSNLSARGQHLREGTLLLDEGRLLRHQEVAMLAAVGRSKARVFRGPRVAFAATGEELVEPGESLTPGRIYNSNAYAVWSQILGARAEPRYLGILRDTEADLREKLEGALEADMIVLSGGISMGRFDLVPQVLRQLGVELLFRRLLVRPGQPTLFGRRGRTLVFGLAGNPISTLYGFDQYVAPAIRAFRHHPQPQAPRYRGELTDTVRKRAGRLHLVPCISEWRDDRYLLTPAAPHGSADMFAIGGVDALALIPAGVEEVARGKMVGFRKLYNPWEGSG
jgi:molybdopterin molybdotransferase